MKNGIVFLLVATILWGGNYICGRFLAPALLYKRPKKKVIKSQP